MDLADPSHPSSNPLILEMSRSAGCEATGQRVLIRTMAGFDASRATGDKRKSKRIAQWLLSIMPQLACYGLAAPGLVPGYLGTGVLGVIWGQVQPTRPSLLGQTESSYPCQSRSLALLALQLGGNLYLIFPSGRDVIMGRCRSWWGTGQSYLHHSWMHACACVCVYLGTWIVCSPSPSPSTSPKSR